MKYLLSIILVLIPFVSSADIVITKNANQLTMHENGKGKTDNIVEFKPPVDDDRRSGVQIFVNDVLVATTKRGYVPWCFINLERNGGKNTLIMEEIWLLGEQCYISSENVEIKNINSFNPSFFGQNVNIENVVSTLDFHASGNNLAVKDVTANRNISIGGTDGDDIINVDNAYISNVDFPKPRQAKFWLNSGKGDDVINLYGVQTKQLDIQGWSGDDDINLGGSRVTGFALIKGGSGIDTYTDTFPNSIEGGMQFRKVEFFDTVGAP